MNQRLILAATVTLAALFTAPAIAQDSAGLKKIAAAGKVVMGVRDASAPLSYTLGGGQYVGYHVDICNKIIDAIKVAAKAPALKTEYTLVTSQNRIPLIENGTVDLECGSTTNNSARQKQVAFALTTYITEVRMAVKADSGITSIAQLNGKTVATTTGTTSVQHLRKHERATGMDFKEVFGKDHSDAFLLLESGRAEAFVMDDNILAGNISNSKTPGAYKIVGEVLSVEPIAIMLKKDDAGMAKIANDTIAAMMKSGELAKVYAKWFEAPIPPRSSNLAMPMGASLKAAIATPNTKPMEDYAKK